MITVNEIVPAFLTACPGMNAEWEKHLEFWKGDESGTFNDMAVIAHYLVDCYDRDDYSEFPAAFALLERCLMEGDEQVREAATIGIIEDIQNIASHRSFGAEVFKRWLLPLSFAAWNEVIAHWQEMGSMADIIRRETGVPSQSPPMPDLEQIQDQGLRRMVEHLYRKT